VENICEASFICEGGCCAVDILRKTNGGWAIYEVKSTSFPEFNGQEAKLEKFQLFLYHAAKLRINEKNAKGKTKKGQERTCKNAFFGLILPSKNKISAHYDTSFRKNAYLCAVVS